MNTRVDIKFSDKSFLLRNGHEMPYQDYLRLKKQYGQGSNDETIYQTYLSEVASNNQGVNRQDATEERDSATKAVFSTSTQPVSVELEKAKYILEHPSIFSKTDVAKAKKIFKLD